jgi:hypothetical protein
VRKQHTKQVTPVERVSPQYLSNNVMELRLHAAEMRLRRNLLSVCVVFLIGYADQKHHTDNDFYCFCKALC